MRLFLLIPASVFILLVLVVAPISAEDYHFKLVEWLETRADGHTLSKGKDHLGVSLLRGQTANLLAGSRMELLSNHGEVVRLGDETIFTLLHDQQVRLSAGEMLLSLPRLEKPFRVQGPATSFWIRDRGTVVAQVTTNRGIKLVCLSGRPTLLAGAQEAVLEPGHVYFLPPGPPRLGRNLLIDLTLFLRTSALIQAFPEKLPAEREIRNTAFRQAVSIQKRTRLFVGDATTAEDFDLLMVED